MQRSQRTSHPAAMEKLLPVLVHIQAHLDCDLSLHHLAQHADMSPYHFHRMFRATIGETLKQYSLRLRLERAAHRLILHAGNILDLALDCGFQNHETFSRDFKRHFGCTPRDYRKQAQTHLIQRHTRETLDLSAVDFQLSRTQFRTLAALDLAFIRHTGPYSQVPDSLWRDLATWATTRYPGQPLIFMGLAQDPPGITPADKLRFDAAVVVPEAFTATGQIAHQRLEVGRCAVTTHVGHFSTLPQAYHEMVARVLQEKDYRLIGLPGIEVYHTNAVNAEQQLNHTDIYLPLALSNSCK